MNEKLSHKRDYYHNNFCNSSALADVQEMMLRESGSKQKGGNENLQHWTSFKVRHMMNGRERIMKNMGKYFTVCNRKSRKY